MRVKLNRAGETSVILTDTEFTKLEDAAAIVDQIAFHYRSDPIGQKGETMVDGLRELIKLMDLESANWQQESEQNEKKGKPEPPAAKAETPK